MKKRVLPFPHTPNSKFKKGATQIKTEFELLNGENQNIVMAPTIFDILLCTGGVCVTVERYPSNDESLPLNLHHRRKKKRTRTGKFQRTKTMKISPTKFTKLERAIAREGGFVLVNPRIHTIQTDYRLEQEWMKKQRKNKKSNNEMSKSSKYTIALRRMRSSSRKLL